MLLAGGLKMPSWALRAVLPTGSVFKGQLSYPMTAIEVPTALKYEIESVGIDYANLYENKNTGFEPKKYRVNSITGTAILATVQIMLVGDLTRVMQAILETLAKGCNGAGLYMDFYDDWISDKQYTGRWVNAGDFVDSSELLCGGSIEMSCFKIQDI
jgi:hypothetical protein